MSDRLSVFFGACKLGDTAKMKRLLTARAGLLHDADEFGQTSLHFACSGGHERAVTLLIAAGADFEAETRDNRRPIHVAAAFGRANVVRALLAVGTDVEAKGPLGRRPLHLAAMNGCVHSNEWVYAECLREILVSVGAPPSIYVTSHAATSHLTLVGAPPGIYVTSRAATSHLSTS